jgi:hypothetical protein
MGQVMLEFNRQQGAPRVVPTNGQLPQDRGVPSATEEQRLSSARRNDANTETLAARSVGGDIPPPVTPQLPPATLIWGHWPWSSALPGDALSVSYAEGRQGGEREMVAGNGYYLLFRSAADSKGILPTDLGRVDFSLRDAQVHFVQDGGNASLGSTRNGWLKVDFGAKQFQTGMTLSHGLGGTTQLNATGSIDRRGKFSATTTDTQLAGALTINGQEAGYTFIRDVANGSFVGITRWVR